MKRIFKLSLFTILSLLLGLLGAFTYLSWQQANNFVFGPRIPFEMPPNAELYQPIEFRTSDTLALRGWYRAPTRADGATILYVHGHRSNRGTFRSWADYLGEMGYGALLFDLRANAESEGDYISMGAKERLDVEAAFAFLATQPEVNPERIAIFGHSMGAATAILAMPQLPTARFVIASAPYSSIRNVLNDRIPETVGIPPLFFPDMIVLMSSYLSKADFYQASPIDVIGNIHQPILLLAGTGDSTVPYTHSEALFAAANEPKEIQLFVGAEHNDIFWTQFDNYASFILPFLERYLSNP